MDPRRTPLLTLFAALLFTLAIGAIGPQTRALAIQQSVDCPTDTEFVAKYEVQGERTLAFVAGSDVIDFSDLQPPSGEVKRFDFEALRLRERGPDRVRLREGRQ
jgi:hypothetical protein